MQGDKKLVQSLQRAAALMECFTERKPAGS